MLVEIEWLDAGLENIQMDYEGACSISPMPRKNCGYLIQKDKEKVIIVFGIIQDRDHKGTLYDQILIIPRGIVTKITELKP